VPAFALDFLGNVIESGAVPLLEKLGIEGPCEKGGLVKLLGVSSRGACPQLHTLFIDIYSPDEDEDEYEERIDEEQTQLHLEAFAAMLEARERLGYCAGLKQLPLCIIRYGSADVNTRILRATFRKMGSFSPVTPSSATREWHTWLRACRHPLVQSLDNYYWVQWVWVMRV